ncbi:MAG: nucleotidyltransferase family protein [Gemmatimonadetes bacterium]|nr:nucleotidyltransferase family protein [Gemmatimonadota bacterium]
MDVPARFQSLLRQTARRLNLPGEQAIIELAGRFGLRRFIERNLRQDPNSQPSPWLDRGARLRKEARAISREFTNARIQHCFFKGIALLGRFYRIEERQLEDTDLLIRATDRNAALSLLLARGYAELGDSSSPTPGTVRPGVTMYRPDADGNVDAATFLDLHWGLEAPTPLIPGGGLPVPDALWPGVQSHGGLPVPRDEHHAALILHHLVRHDLLHVRGLLDLALLWDALPPSGGSDLTALCRRLGVGRALGIVGHLLVSELKLTRLLGVRTEARDWRSRMALERMRLADWLLRAARSTTHNSRHLLITRSRAWRRFLLADAPKTGRLFRELIVPPRDYLRWRWPKARSDADAWRQHLALAWRS